MTIGRREPGDNRYFYGLIDEVKVWNYALSQRDIALEYNGAPLWLVHVAGITFLAGRLIHARGILRERFKGRVLGMQLTIWTILALAAANLLFLPSARLFGQ